MRKSKRITFSETLRQHPLFFGTLKRPEWLPVHYGFISKPDDFATVVEWNSWLHTFERRNVFYLGKHGIYKTRVAGVWDWLRTLGKIKLGQRFLTGDFFSLDPSAPSTKKSFICK